MQIDSSRLGKPKTEGTNEYLAAMFAPSTSATTEVPLDMLTPWRDADHATQPFHPYSPQKLADLAENIAEMGVLSPLFLRPFEGKYQILAGHNRAAAAKLAGLTTVPAIIRTVDDATAVDILVDTNLHQREEPLFSEKAFAYRLRLESVKQQGARTDLTSRQLVGKLNDETGEDPTSRQVVAKLDGARTIGEIAGESGRQIQRYIRLTYLIPSLLDFVDTKAIPFTAGVALSCLIPAQQEMLEQVMAEYEIEKVTHKQAEALRACGEDLDEETILEILGKHAAGDAPKAAAQTVTFKVPQENLPESAKKYAADPALLLHIARTVRQFLETEGGDA